MARMGFGSPGTRDYTTQKIDLKSQLLQPLITALAGILVTDVIMLVPVLSAFLIGQWWLPVAFGVMALVAFPMAMRAANPKIRKEPLLVWATTAPIAAISIKIGVDLAPIAWAWLQPPILALPSESA